MDYPHSCSNSFQGLQLPWHPHESELVFTVEVTKSKSKARGQAFALNKCGCQKSSSG